MKNEIRDGQVGVSVAAVAWTPYSIGDSMADNNKVVNNIIENQADLGVSIGTWSDGSYTASADNNKVIRNRFSNCTEDIEDGGTATKSHANVFL